MSTTCCGRFEKVHSRREFLAKSAFGFGGVGLAYLWRPSLVLLGMAVVLLTASTHAFHERLDG